MNFAEVTNRLLDLEDELELLEMEVGGVPFWERVRFFVNRTLLQKLDVIGQAHTHPRLSYGGSLYKLLRNLFIMNPLLAPKAEILVWGHERRKQLEDGLWWDIYCDPVLDGLTEDWVYLEKEYETGHLTPARTEDVYYLDLLKYIALLSAEALRGPFSPELVMLSSDERDTLNFVEDEIVDRFGIRLNLEEIVASRLLKRKVHLPLYRRILHRVDPDLAVVVVSYGRETFIEACQDEGVRVAELQHGEISEYHMGYHYPNGPKRHFPDYFLTFGEFWTSAADFPIPMERILPVGYPYLERRAAKYEDADTKQQVVFLSQGEPGERLSRFAAEFAAMDHEWDVVYKLHPGEYNRWRREYPWLEDASLRIVDDSGPSLYELFAQSSTQVGAYSTALYEGLYFDLDTYIIDVPGIECIRRLIDTGSVTLVQNGQELYERLGSPSQGEKIDLSQLFHPRAESNVVSTLRHLRETNTHDHGR